MDRIRHLALLVAVCSCTSSLAAQVPASDKSHRSLETSMIPRSSLDLRTMLENLRRYQAIESIIKDNKQLNNGQLNLDPELIESLKSYVNQNIDRNNSENLKKPAIEYLQEWMQQQPQQSSDPGGTSALPKTNSPEGPPPQPSAGQNSRRSPGDPQPPTGPGTTSANQNNGTNPQAGSGTGRRPGTGNAVPKTNVNRLLPPGVGENQSLPNITVEDFLKQLDLRTTPGRPSGQSTARGANGNSPQSSGTPNTGNRNSPPTQPNPFERGGANAKPPNTAPGSQTPSPATKPDKTKSLRDQLRDIQRSATKASRSPNQPTEEKEETALQKGFMRALSSAIDKTGDDIIKEIQKPKSERSSRLTSFMRNSSRYMKPVQNRTKELIQEYKPKTPLPSILGSQPDMMGGSELIGGGPNSRGFVASLVTIAGLVGVVAFAVWYQRRVSRSSTVVEMDISDVDVQTSAIQDRESLIRACHGVALRRLGLNRLWWNPKRAFRRLGQLSGRASQSEQLNKIYDTARYTPESKLTDEDFESARTALTELEMSIPRPDSEERDGAHR